MGVTIVKKTSLLKNNARNNSKKPSLSKNNARNNSKEPSLLRNNEYHLIKIFLIRKILQ